MTYKIDIQLHLRHSNFHIALYDKFFSLNLAHIQVLKLRHLASAVVGIFAAKSTCIIWLKQYKPSWIYGYSIYI